MAFKLNTFSVIAPLLIGGLSIADGADVTGSTTLFFAEGAETNPAGPNQIDTTITIDPSGGLPPTYSASDSTLIINEPGSNPVNYSRVDIDLTIDAVNDNVVSFSLANGRFYQSDTKFAGGNPFYYTFEFNFEGISSTIYTHGPRSLISNPATGEYSSADHTRITDTGILSGWTKAGSLGQKEYITPRDFSVEPSGGPGNGTGNITLSRTSTVNGLITYEITMQEVVDVYDVQVDENGGQFITDSDGIILATGTIVVGETPYLNWTLIEGITGANPNDDHNADGVENLIAWAMGLGANDNAKRHLPKANADGSFTIDLPVTGTASDILIQTSSDLASWSTLTPGRCSLGANPMPAGSANTVSITPSGQKTEFIRFMVTE